MTAKLRVTTRPLDHDGHLLEFAPDEPLASWLRHDEGFVAWGEAARISHDGPDRFAGTSASWHDITQAAYVDDSVSVPGSGLIAVASFTFDDRARGSSLVVPRRIVGRHAGRAFVTTINGEGNGEGDGEGDGDIPEPQRNQFSAPGPGADRVRFAGSSIPDTDWLVAVADAVTRIENGDFEKVVLARDHAVWSRHAFDPRALAWRLNARFPGCFTFIADGLVGASPELLIRKLGRTVESVTLAGTTRRDVDAAADAALGEALLASVKDLHEHQFAADSVVRSLSSACEDVSTGRGVHLMRLDNVQHLATRVTATLAADNDSTALDLAGLLHPTAAVGGTPSVAAAEAIRELERMDRGRYAAPVGWIDAAGDGEFAIALRCAQIEGARARLFAGAGVVEGSLPEEELEETRVKLLAMRSAFG